MKNLIKLLAISCLLVVSVHGIGQEINKLGNGVSRGKLTLRDGKSVDFRNLQVMNDSTISYSVDGSIVIQKSTDIYKVVKFGNYAGLYAIAGALGGLAGSIEGLGSYSSDYGGLIVVCTAGGAAIGALWGLTVKKETIVFKNSNVLSFYPTISTDQFGKYYPMLSVKINLY